jgi:hypothetical protein
MNNNDDDDVFVSYGVVFSIPYRLAAAVRSMIEKFPGARIVYQTISRDDLILLKKRSAQRILAGELEELSEILDRKEGRR